MTTSITTQDEVAQTNKIYIGISRDHSGSMSHLANPALRDFNETIQLLQENSQATGQETFVSVVNCGDGRYARVSTDIQNIPVSNVPTLTRYQTDAPGTPLFDSVGELIRLFESSPDANNPDVSFLVMAVTDGEENCSRTWNSRTLTEKIKILQNTDRWTFVFRVPRGYKRRLVQMGIHEGNIFEWDQTAKGVTEATVATCAAFTEFYSGVKSGVKSTTSFYTNLKDVDLSQVKQQLIDISTQIHVWHVDTEAEGKNIREYCKFKLGREWKKGAAFYELTKKERAVQDYKLIVIQDKTSKACYSGPHARDLLGLPHYGTCSIIPEDHGNYNIFVQSTSVNRKLPVGTNVLYWENYS